MSYLVCKSRSNEVKYNPFQKTRKDCLWIVKTGKCDEENHVNNRGE